MAPVATLQKRVVVLAAPALAVAGCGLFDPSSGQGADAGETLPSGDGEPGSGDPADAAAPAPDAPDVDELPARVRDAIRSDAYTRLVFEVDVVEGMAPRDGVEAQIEALFADVLDKPGGIEAVRDDVLDPRGSDHAWSYAELQELAGDTFDLDTDAQTTSFHTLWVDGHSDRDGDGGRILGLQFGRHIVLFKETIEDVCTGAATLPTQEPQVCRATERAIWIHEIGHAIGLVDNGLPMAADHKDPDRGAHSDNDDCIMYWAYQGGSLGDRVFESLFGDQPTLGFDEYCLADIAAVRDAR
jgi:hypothetical protein